MAKILLSSLALLWLTAAHAVAQQQPDPLDEVRALYDSAAYEDALARLAQVEDAPTARAEQYRAFCLLALGRRDEAAASVAKAVTADPLWMPAAGDASPRVQAFYTDERRKLLPDIVRAAYTQARAAYAAQNYTEAVVGFARVRQLATGVQEPGSPLADLLMLSDDFLKLAQNAANAAKAAAAAAPTAGSTPPSVPAAQPRPSAPQPAATGETRPPVAVSQKMPAWTNQAWRGNRDGLVHVEIDESGAVTKVTILRPTDPRYDLEVVDAARAWRYEPALRLGRPIASSKDINYNLKTSR